MAEDNNDNVFDFDENTENPSTDSDNQNQDNTNPESDPVSQLVGEGKKFKTVEDLARGKQESDNFIQSLQQQVTELREELNKQDFAKDLLEKVKNNMNNKENEPHDKEKAEEVQTSTSNSKVDEGNLEKMIRDLMTEEEKKKTAQNNLKTVQSKLQETYGENAKRELQNKANELGMSADDLQDVAVRSPQAFFRLVGMDSTDNTSNSNSQTAPIPGDKNSAAYQSNQTGREVRDWNYYENLRKTDRKRYFDPKTQRQMMEDKKRLGDKFGMPSR